MVRDYTRQPSCTYSSKKPRGNMPSASVLDLSPAEAMRRKLEHGFAAGCKIRRPKRIGEKPRKTNEQLIDEAILRARGMTK